MSSTSAVRIRSIEAKHVLWAFYGLMVLFVLYHNERPFLDSHSPIWQHFAKVKWLLLPHGICGGLALLLGPLQFSTRLRQRNLRLHRILGRIYIGSVLIAAPVAIPIAIIQGPPTLIMAATIQSTGWLLTTAAALYCIRTGNIKQHREWMIRSYPFAMVFVVVRTILAIPAIDRIGLTAVVSVVWSVIAAACFVPTFILSWRATFPRKVPLKVRAAAQGL